MKRFNGGSRNKSGGRERSGGRDLGRSSGRSSGRFGGRDSGRSRTPREMHEVTCDKCGKRCEVPFKPTSSKPVYCSDCFKKDEHFESKNKPDQFTKEFDQINRKLDKILEALEIN